MLFTPYLYVYPEIYLTSFKYEEAKNDVSEKLKNASGIDALIGVTSCVIGSPPNPKI
jgi:hypothetical protein